MLLIVTCYPPEANQMYFPEQLSSNFDNATCESLPITMMGDYNSDFLTTFEQDNLETVIVLYGFSVVGIKTITTIQRKFPTAVPFMSSQALALNCFYYSAFFLLLITSTFLLALEKK